MRTGRSASMGFWGQLGVGLLGLAILALSSPASAARWSPVPQWDALCSQRFASLFGEHEAVLAQFRQKGLLGLNRQGILKVESVLEKRTLGSYFGHEQLKSDVGAYFEIQCLKFKSDCKELVSWWRAHSEQYVENPKFISVFADPKWTIKDLSELASSQFYAEVGRTKSSVWREKFGWLFHPRTIIATAGAIGVSVGAKILGTIYNAATLGTMMRLWNAYTDAAVAPIEAYLRQQGNRHLGDLAAHIQEWLIARGRAREELDALKQEAEEAKEKLLGSRVDPETATRLWQEFQNYFFGKFLLFHQGLPGGIRDGRAFVYGAEFEEPMLIATFISSRYDGYRQARREVRVLEERVDSGKASESEREDLFDQYRYIELQKKQIASGLAIFLIRKYMYRDDIFKNVFEKDKALLVQMDQIQHDLIAGMGINFFMVEFFQQLEETFKQYELIFRAADMQAQLAIEQATQKGSQKAR